MSSEVIPRIHSSLTVLSR